MLARALTLEMRKILETSEYMTFGWAFQHFFYFYAGLGKNRIGCEFLGFGRCSTSQGPESRT